MRKQYAVESVQTNGALGHIQHVGRFEQLENRIRRVTKRVLPTNSSDLKVIQRRSVSKEAMKIKSSNGSDNMK